MDTPTLNKRFHLRQLSSQDKLAMLRQDVKLGLIERPRSLPPKYFYDEIGSKLFDSICKTHDYYPTRTELALLQKHANEIVALVNSNTCVELGAGTSAKSEVLLSEISAHFNKSKFNYISIDVCEEVLVETAERLQNNFENLFIQSIVGEYIPSIQVLPNFDDPVLFMFIGSSIGNFTEQESIDLLSNVAKKMTFDDHFLIGMDRVKDKNVLEQAYDDREGVTAKFNLNVLTVLNTDLRANFNLDNFSHQAVYNENEQQIEMYLISNSDQQVHFVDLNETLHFERGEKILTEISRKYSKESIHRLLGKSGLVEVKHYEPDNKYFSLVLVKRKNE